jgi:glutathione reductase (NADPH)
VLWAIGRRPNIEDVGLESAGIDLDAEGYIDVDKYQNTSAAGVYAVGDVCGEPELTPVAIAAGRRLADRVFGGMTDRHLSYDVIPSVVFSHPPSAPSASPRTRRASAFRTSRSASTRPSSCRCSTR